MHHDRFLSTLCGIHSQASQPPLTLPLSLPDSPSRSPTQRDGHLSLTSSLVSALSHPRQLRYAGAAVTLARLPHPLCCRRATPESTDFARLRYDHGGCAGLYILFTAYIILSQTPAHAQQRASAIARRRLPPSLTRRVFFCFRLDLRACTFAPFLHRCVRGQEARRHTQYLDSPAAPTSALHTRLGRSLQVASVLACSYSPPLLVQ